MTGSIFRHLLGNEVKPDHRAALSDQDALEWPHLFAHAQFQQTPKLWDEFLEQWKLLNEFLPLLVFLLLLAL